MVPSRTDENQRRRRGTRGSSWRSRLGRSIPVRHGFVADRSATLLERRLLVEQIPSGRRRENKPDANARAPPQTKDTQRLLRLRRGPPSAAYTRWVSRAAHESEEPLESPMRPGSILAHPARCSCHVYKIEAAPSLNAPAQQADALLSLGSASSPFS